ncbi:MAG: hypothetical protein BroJett011_46630 [Chloroflexota bacterium]|nr:MAG: hypothetical protein BroJett011_46630 [Chloroflexota bacterium]
MLKKRLGMAFLLSFCLVIILFVSLALLPKPIQASSSAAPYHQSPTTVTLANGYQITFLGVTYHGDQTSTWRYYVKELPSAQDLSNWVLALPFACDADVISVITASPEPWEMVNPDPNAHLDGVKWQTGAGFQQGEFTVTLAGPVALGQTQVAAKGPDLAYGVIAGPVCGLDLAIAKRDSLDPAKVGEPLTYTLTVTNSSFADATNIVVTDTLPASVSFGSATSSQGSCSGTTLVTCNLGTLAGGATATITIVVTPTVEGVVITNQAEVTATEPDPNLANNTASEDTLIRPAADLSITKTGSPDPAKVNEPLTYTLTVTNTGPDDANNVVVTDTLPAGINLGTATPSQGSCSDLGPVTCSLGTLTNGASATITIIVTPTIEGSILTNQAEIRSAQLDPDVTNNTASETTVVRPAADLVIIKTDSPDPVIVGKPLTYTLTITNAGPDDATNVVVTDTLPANVIFGSAIASQGSCSGTNLIICGLGTLANGATAKITIVVTPTVTGIITNMAQVRAAQPDLSLANNTATQTTQVIGLGNNCTLTQGYWKSHPDAWPVKQITIGGVTYPQAEALAIFNIEPDGDATYILAHQLLAAKLNILNGADPSSVTNTVVEADDWLNEHPLGSNPSNPDREAGIKLSETLDKYNRGLIGPGRCAPSQIPSTHGLYLPLIRK